MIRVFYWSFIAQTALFIARINQINVNPSYDFIGVLILGFIIITLRQTIDLEIKWLRILNMFLTISMAIIYIISTLLLIYDNDIGTGRRG